MTQIVKYLEINSQHFLTIIRIINLAGGEARVVGGAVRDSLLNIPSSDIDIATNIKPDHLIDILQEHKIRTIPTGIKFGTITAIIEDESFEITTLRRDINCDGRHSLVVYSNDFFEDAARRDFTINALSYCPITHVIFDYFGGIDDLKNNKLVFIGDAKERIQEDYLRILRFFRFSCRYAKTLDESGLSACEHYKDKLLLLSKERIKSEMDLLLKLPKSPEIILKMSELSILQKILPVKKYDKNLHIKALNLFSKFEIKTSLPVLYAIIFHDTELSLEMLLKLKFSKLLSNSILAMKKLQSLSSLSEIIIELKKIWLSDKSYIDYFIYGELISKDDGKILDLYHDLKTRKIPIFPVNGNDLILLGYRLQKIKKGLTFMKNQWIKSNFTLNKTELINLVKNNAK